MRPIRKRILSFALVALCAVVFAVSADAQVNTGIEFGNATGLSNQDIRVTIARIIQIALGFLGVIALGLIMYAGFIWMTAKGNEEKVTQAKTILKNAGIGLAIILSSFAIVTFILNSLVGATTGNQGGNQGNNTNGQGIGSLGNGIIESVYPEPFQKNVPRNTSIIVTFRQPIQAASICDSVTNESPAKCAPGAKIRPTSVKIFRTTIGDNSATNTVNVAAFSNDNMTFVFKPAAPDYLGSALSAFDYTVNLTQNVKKADGQNAFGLADFRWTFEVSNLLDLISPKIVAVGDGGIFPLPDSEGDVVSGQSQATVATGTITVGGQPNAYRAAAAVVSRTTPPPTPVGARAEGTNTCSDGTVTVSILNATTARIGYTQPGLLPADIAIINNTVSINPCSLTLVLDAGFAVGTSWQIAVQRETQPDTLTIGSKMYSFIASGQPNANQIAVGGSRAATAANIASAVNSIHPEMTATSNQAVVTVRTKVAGSSGNNLELSTSNPVALAVSRMQGGSDATTTFTIKGRQDQPKNAVIQINFNETVNPLTVAGTSQELAPTLRIVNDAPAARAANADCAADNECLSYKCSNGKCQGDQIAGKFVVSNQYKTVEFISDIKCGVNGCGESVYCLPANSSLRVEATAAALLPCSTNGNCTVSPFNVCTAGVCSDPSSGKNYPVASGINGILDIADNSLDGNRNDNPQGQTATWDENQTIQDNGGKGDNYRWSFWVSDRLDLTSPKILSTSVVNNQSRVSLAQAIEVVFSKLMLSSSLSTGSIIIDNGLEQVTHKLVNLWSLANDPIGYWVQKIDRDVDPVDGRPDRTSAILGHGIFSDSTLYQAQVGSGVKDIYQNCYKPSGSQTCNATAAKPSCCRDTNGSLVPTAILTPDGNCP